MSKPVQLMSRINAHTPYARGKVSGAVDRRRRDEIGEKLEGLRKRSVEMYRATGVKSGPFKVRDWER